MFDSSFTARGLSNKLGDEDTGEGCVSLEDKNERLSLPDKAVGMNIDSSDHDGERVGEYE